MEDKIKDIREMDSQVLDSVSGGGSNIEEPDGAMGGVSECQPSCKASDCVLIRTAPGLLYKKNHHYVCKRCGKHFVKGWPMNGADNSILYK